MEEKKPISIGLYTLCFLTLPIRIFAQPEVRTQDQDYVNIPYHGLLPLVNQAGMAIPAWLTIICLFSNPIHSIGLTSYKLLSPQNSCHQPRPKQVMNKVGICAQPMMNGTCTKYTSFYSVGEGGGGCLNFWVYFVFNVFTTNFHYVPN